MLDYSTNGSKHFETRIHVYYNKGLLVGFLIVFFSFNKWIVSHIGLIFLESWGQSSEALRHHVLRVSQAPIHVADTPAESVFQTVFFPFFFFLIDQWSQHAWEAESDYATRHFVPACERRRSWQIILRKQRIELSPNTISEQFGLEFMCWFYNYTCRLSMLSFVPWNMWD